MKSNSPRGPADSCTVERLEPCRKPHIYERIPTGRPGQHESRTPFRYRNRVADVGGFYDGGGVYRIRFMPDAIGSWSYTTSSNVAALNGKAGSLTAVAPQPGNLGPMRVAFRTHFAYADGAPWPYLAVRFQTAK